MSQQEGPPVLETLPPEEEAPRGAQLPQDLDAERSVLGACMLRRDTVAEVEETGLQPEDFHLVRHQFIWEAVQHLAVTGQPTDALVLASELEARGTLEQAGGRAYLHDLLSETPSAAAGKHYAVIVRERAGLRSLVTAGRQLIELGQGSGAVEEVMAAASATVTKVVNSALVVREETLDVVADRAMLLLEEAEPYVPTPWSGLNEIFDGARARRFYVIAARPAAGKTMFALQWLLSHARQVRDTGGFAAYLTWEMSAERLYQRALCQRSGVPGERIRKGDLTERDWQALTQADIGLRQLPLHLVGASGWTASKARAKVRNLARGHTGGLVVVDHIGLTRAERQGRDSRQMELTEAADVLLETAHECGVTVVVVSQLNRNPLGRADKRPELSDIRDTDRLEQNADLALLLYRDKDGAPGELEVNVAKYRDGSEGLVTLRFNGDHARIDDPGQQ